MLSQCNNFVILRLSNDQDHEAIVAGVASLRAQSCAKLEEDEPTAVE